MLIERLLKSVPGVIGLLGGFGIFAILFMTAYEVIARYLFDAPTSWSVEISTYVLVGAVYMGAGLIHRIGANIRVELLLTKLRDHSRTQLEEVSAWSGLGFALLAAWQVGIYTYSNFQNKTASYILQVPQWIPNIPILLGLIGLILALLDEASSIHRAQPSSSSTRKWAATIIIAICGALLLGSDAKTALSFAPLDIGGLYIFAAMTLAALARSGWKVAAGTAAIWVVLGLSLFVSKTYYPGATIGLLFLFVLLLFLIGLRISLGLGILGAVCAYVLLPFPMPAAVAERAISSVDSFSLTALPMFVLMGSLLVRSGIAIDMFSSLQRLIGQIPGGIANASVGACTLFAAVSGSSVATAATIGGIACPEMIRRGYSPRLAYGSVAAGGTLGILIPPSVPLIIYGTLAGVSVSKLFMAGIVPGLLVAIAFIATIYLWTSFFPNSAPRSPAASANERLTGLLGLLPFLILMFMILGSMYFGIVTPTEAGAIGALLSMIVCVGRRRLSWSGLWESVIEALTVTSFIALIMFGASLLTYIFDFLRLAQNLVTIVSEVNLSPTSVLIAIVLIYILLGMFLDSISLITMTLPVLFPLMTNMAFDPVWLGIILVVLAEIGLITPPVGMNLFVLQGISKIPLREIVLGSTPFLVVMLIMVAAFYKWPQIVLFLPNNVR